MGIEEMRGRVVTRIDAGKDEVVFRLDLDNRMFRMYHERDCCEIVQLEEVVGDFADLVGAPLLEAEEVEGYTGPTLDGEDSYTWTFYKLRTVKGGVTLRWLGRSNGYYSESVAFAEVKYF